MDKFKKVIMVGQYDKQALKELIHIRCLLEGIWLDTKESKEGCSTEHVEERAKDELEDAVAKEELIEEVTIPLRPA